MLHGLGGFDEGGQDKAGERAADADPFGAGLAELRQRDIGIERPGQ